LEQAFFIKGVILGFSIAAPVGPIGVLCIRRTLANGLITGILSGFGTATADTVYGCIAGFGLTAVSSFLLRHQYELRLLGGLFLLYLGLATFRALPAQTSPKDGSDGLIGSYTSAFFLTLTNPMTIISFAAIFAGLGLGTAKNYAAAIWLVTGVFAGSMLWWLILSGTVNALREHFDQRRLRWVNRLSGLIIAAFGIASLMTIR
jgi:threonine/homoserine/homoserine lactone efflux protein